MAVAVLGGAEPIGAAVDGTVDDSACRRSRNPAAIIQSHAVQIAGASGDEAIEWDAGSTVEPARALL